jgi:hypothetical protein
MYVYCLNFYGGLEHDRGNKRLSGNPRHRRRVPRELLLLAIRRRARRRRVVSVVVPELPARLGADYRRLDALFASIFYYKARPNRRFRHSLLRWRCSCSSGLRGGPPAQRDGPVDRVYFALVFTAGHMNHEVKDHDADRAAGLHTNAVIYGPRRMFNIAFICSPSPSAIWRRSAPAGVISWALAWPYLAIYPPHLLLHLLSVTGRRDRLQQRLQVIYRSLFLLAAVALFLTQRQALDRENDEMNRDCTTSSSSAPGPAAARRL